MGGTFYMGDLFGFFVSGLGLWVGCGGAGVDFLDGFFMGD